MAKQTQTSALTIPEVFEIGALSINKEKLQALLAEDTKLLINGISDTTGYKTAIAKRGEYRTLRTSLEKHRKDLSKPHQDYIKSLKIATDGLGELAYTGEEYFDGMISAIDNEKEKIKQEKLLEQQRRVSARVSLLTERGAIFDGETYVFNYSEDIAVSLSDVQSWSDETFALHLGSVIEAYNLEIDRLDEIKRQEAEAEQERQAEAERVKQQAEANELEQKNLLAKRTALRIKEIKIMGFAPDNEGDYMNPKNAYALSPYMIENSTDAIWETMIKEVEDAIANYKEPVVADEKLEEAYNQDHTVEPLGIATELNPEFVVVESVSRVVRFSLDEPYTDIDITPKMFVRIFPDEYRDIATDGIQWANTGITLQGLNWAVTKRS